MKKNMRKIAAVVLLLGMLLSITALGAENASAYISSYTAWHERINGVDKIFVYMAAVDTMDDLGVRSVYIFNARTEEEVARIYYYEDASMMIEDAATYANAFNFTGGTPGQSYYAVVTFYAGNSNGFETRDYVTSDFTVY